MKPLSYRRAALLYALFFLALSWPYWLAGEVVAPHRQFTELARADDTGATHPENRKFTDVTNSYIPEIGAHLAGPRSGWLATWTAQNELGRPLYQVSGFSPAYLPVWLLSRAVHDPWVLLSTLALCTCFLAGAFLLLFCREAGLAPMAGLLASTGLAAAPPLMYWLSFPMFLSVWCWSAAVLWSVTRLHRRPDLLGWCVLAFSGYSLLMTAYPQLVVFHAYLLGGYGLSLAFSRWRAERSAALRFAALCVSALALGMALAMPVYRDLLVLSSESARVAPGPSFFTAALPRVASLAEALRFVALSTVPEVFGNPIAATFALPYDGLSMALPTAFFAVAGLACALRRTWGWWLAIALLVLFAFKHDLYVFGVQNLGFHLSRSTPIGSITLPLAVISAFGADALASRSSTGERLRALVWSTVACLALLLTALVYGLGHGLAIRWPSAMGLALVIGLLAAQRQRMRPLWLGAAVAITAATTAFPLMLRQDPRQIASTSALVERVRQQLPPGARLSVAAPGIAALPPNLNAGLDLPSVHTYNGLSAKRYHHLVAQLGGQVSTYGRWNGFIAPDYGGVPFWM